MSDRTAVALLTLACLAATCLAQDAATSKPHVDDPYVLPKLLKEAPPLSHDANGRLQMIVHLPFRLSEKDDSFRKAKPFPDAIIRALVRRGLTQWIPPDTKYIPFAKALQRNGAQVILFQGYAFNSPGGDPEGSLHQLPADFEPGPGLPQQPNYPCPHELAGWRDKADELRKTFQAFKDAGVDITAVWWDWEVEPHTRRRQWRFTKACKRCRKQFPPGVLDDFGRWRAYTFKLRRHLFSTYFAAPVLEVYPQASVTNWAVVLSTRERPTQWYWGYGTEPLPREKFTNSVQMGAHVRITPYAGLELFNTANPVVYGNTLYFRRYWRKDWNWPGDVPHMDRVYTHVMLGQISQHADNAQRLAPASLSVPWVDRFCPDDGDRSIPILSRKRYREILRHCWLRGADGMQIFNVNWQNDDPVRARIQVEEVVDAVVVYDEMLAYRKFLEKGFILNTDVPAVKYDGPIWSGLRLGDEAVIRTFTQAARPVEAKITPFDNGPRITLKCPPGGGTYLLKLADGKIAVVEAPDTDSRSMFCSTVLAVEPSVFGSSFCMPGVRRRALRWQAPAGRLKKLSLRRQIPRRTKAQNATPNPRDAILEGV